MGSQTGIVTLTILCTLYFYFYKIIYNSKCKYRIIICHHIFFYLETKLMQERALEKATMNKDHHRAMDHLRKEQKRDQDVS